MRRGEDGKERLEEDKGSQQDNKSNLDVVGREILGKHSNWCAASRE
jgi:hypothetical protein